MRSGNEFLCIFSFKTYRRAQRMPSVWMLNMAHAEPTSRKARVFQRPRIRALLISEIKQACGRTQRAAGLQSLVTDFLVQGPSVPGRLG